MSIPVALVQATPEEIEEGSRAKCGQNASAPDIADMSIAAVLVQAKPEEIEQDLRAIYGENGAPSAKEPTEADRDRQTTVFATMLHAATYNN